MRRKKSEIFYTQHGFTAKYVNGKHVAACNVCHKELHNTALTRLSIHRNSCNKPINGVKTENAQKQTDAKQPNKIKTVPHITSDEPDFKLESPIFFGCEDEHMLDLQFSEESCLDENNKILDININNEAAKPNKSSLADLKVDKVKAEIKQFQSKTQYLTTETENLKLQRILIALKIKKLKLEIHAMRPESSNLNQDQE